jgi:hypothetical protein
MLIAASFSDEKTTLSMTLCTAEQFHDKTSNCTDTRFFTGDKAKL